MTKRTHDLAEEFGDVRATRDPNATVVRKVTLMQHYRRERR